MMLWIKIQLTNNNIHQIFNVRAIQIYANVAKFVYYRSDTVNSNTVNLKFHLIWSFFEIFARFLSFHV